MEYTKGELEKVEYGLLQINGETVLCAFPGFPQTAEDIELRNANSERALICWNSHDKLVKALEEIRDDEPQDEFDAIAVFATKLQNIAKTALAEVDK